MPAERDTELTFNGRACPECLEHIHQLMARLWQQEPSVGELDRMLFCTAVIEVANNIVEHGSGGGSTKLSLALQANPRQLTATFVDDGAQADVDLDGASLPDDSSDSGRGLFLARAAADELSYERKAGVNRWILVVRSKDVVVDS